MAIYMPKGSRYWWISIYRGGDEPRLRVSTGTEDEAEARSLETAMKQAIAGDPAQQRQERLVTLVRALTEPEKPTMRVSLANAMDVYRRLPSLDIGETMLRIRGYHLDAFTRWAAANCPRVVHLDDVGRDVAMAYGDHLSEITNTGKTYNAHRADLHAIWEGLLVRAGLQENVWSLLPTASTRDSLSGRAFTVDEEERIFEACRKTTMRGDWYGACLVGRYTGLRWGDVVSLRWEWIEGDVMLIKPAKNRRQGRQIIVPLHRRLVAYLDQRRVSLDQHGYIFPELRERRSRKVDGAKIEQNFVRILEAAGIEASGAKLSYHCWRHTWRTRLAAAGVSDEDAMRLGGWSTDVHRIYDHDVTRARAAIDRLD